MYFHAGCKKEFSWIVFALVLVPRKERSKFHSYDEGRNGELTSNSWSVYKNKREGEAMW